MLQPHHITTHNVPKYKLDLSTEKAYFESVVRNEPYT